MPRIYDNKARHKTLNDRINRKGNLEKLGKMMGQSASPLNSLDRTVVKEKAK